MKHLTTAIVLAMLLSACSGPSTGPSTGTATASATSPAESIHINGSWRLVTGITITKGDSTVTDYTKNQSMIKIVNDSHFAFLRHGLGAARDSAGMFDAGGGRYTLNGDKYTEHLDYYNDKNWEGKAFDFTVSINHDTLIQRGVEKVEKENVDRVIIEKYLRIKE
jgi:hypothetical protein